MAQLESNAFKLQAGQGAEGLYRLALWRLRHKGFWDFWEQLELNNENSQGLHGEILSQGKKNKNTSTYRFYIVLQEGWSHQKLHSN